MTAAHCMIVGAALLAFEYVIAAALRVMIGLDPRTPSLRILTPSYLMSAVPCTGLAAAQIWLIASPPIVTPRIIFGQCCAVLWVFLAGIRPPLVAWRDARARRQ